MPDIRLTNINKSYVSGQRAVKDLDLFVPDGSFTCLLGPSGCGKTTTLRMIAGLEHPTWGTITVGDRVLDAVEKGVYVPPERRGMGLVFQSYALWPHLTVNQNVEFGLRMKKKPAKVRAQRVAETLRLMQIEGLGGRYPAELSGGQQQRVSLARMLAVDPTVLLLDEPLSNLDARLRLEMRAELKRLHDATGHTFVFVTHDQIEAMTMATHVAVMHDGVLEQMAPPMEVYRRPATRFVAEFVGSPPMNFLDLSGDGDVAAALRSTLTARGVDLDEVASIGVRPESLHLGPSAATSPDTLSFTAQVTAVLPTGSSSTVSLRSGQDSLFALAYDDLTAAVGARINCRTAVADLHVFGSDGNRLAAWDDTCRHELEEVG